MADIEKIEQALRDGLEGVTPGPWKHVCPDRGYCIDYIVTENPAAKNDQNHSDYIAETGNVAGPRGVNFFEKDAAHIARCSPENIRILLDELSRLRTALATIRDEPEVHTKLNQERLCCKFQDIAARVLSERKEGQADG